MTAYYNEIDPFAAEWLRELIKAGHIAPGDVDERSIEDVKPNELMGYTQCHFFAGVGVWSYALRQAGWPDDKPVWTGSCPCQPFSTAGKKGGIDDERHLWPSFHWLIQQCRPAVVFGEQVASAEIFGSKLEVDFAVAVRARDITKANKLAKKLVRQKGFTFQPRWIDLVHADMEGLGYAFGYRAFPAAGVGAPHIRDRAYWVANSGSEGLQGQRGLVGINGSQGRENSERHSGASGLVCGLADCESDDPGSVERSAQSRAAGATNGRWADADWLACRDGKWRPVEPAFKQMVDGLACAMVYLRNEGANEKTRKIINETATDANAREILREMQESDAPEAVWLSTGGQIGFYEATILLSFMLEYEGQLGNFIYRSEAGGAKACKELLREMRKDRAASCSSYRPRYTQQFASKLEDSLSELPQAGALEVLKSLNGSPLAVNPNNRVGRLRGYGNAINAEAAKKFVESFIDDSNPASALVK